MNEKNLTRDEYVYEAKLHERAERFDDMVKSINNFVKLDHVPSNKERNVISSKRSSWRLLNYKEKKE